MSHSEKGYMFVFSQPLFIFAGMRTAGINLTSFQARMGNLTAQMCKMKACNDEQAYLLIKFFVCGQLKSVWFQASQFE